MGRDGDETHPALLPLPSAHKPNINLPRYYSLFRLLCGRDLFKCGLCFANVAGAECDLAFGSDVWFLFVPAHAKLPYCVSTFFASAKQSGKERWRRGGKGVERRAYL